jgi:hypothetical protein
MEEGGGYLKISPLKLFVLTFVCSLIFSIVFVTIQRIDAYLNPPPTPVIKMEKVK